MSNEQLKPHSQELQPFNLEKLPPDTQLVFCGETNHKSPDQHDAEKALIPELAKRGFNVLAMEGISPEHNQKLRELKLFFSDNPQEAEKMIIDFTVEQWKSTVGDPALYAQLLITAFTHNIQPVGVDIPNDEYPKYEEMIDSERLEQLMEEVDILQNQVDSGNSDAGILARISEIEAEAVSLLQHTSNNINRLKQETILDRRNEVMAGNIRRLIGMRYKVIALIGFRHITEEPNSAFKKLADVSCHRIILQDNNEFPSKELFDGSNNISKINCS